MERNLTLYFSHVYVVGHFSDLSFTGISSSSGLMKGEVNGYTTCKENTMQEYRNYKTHYTTCFFTISTHVRLVFEMNVKCRHSPFMFIKRLVEKRTCYFRYC